MGLLVEKAIETAFKTEIAKDAYIVANRIPGRAFNDNSSVSSMPEYVVQCEPSQIFEGNSVLFECPVTIFCFTAVRNDKSMAILDAIYQSVLSVVRSTSMATLTTSGGTGCPVFNAVRIVQGIDKSESEDGAVNMRAVKCIAHVTKI